VTEDLHELFAASAAGMPDVPDRLDRVLARRRRRSHLRSAAAVGTTALLVTGVAVLVPVLRQEPDAPTVVAAAPGDCAHGGAPLPQDEELAPLPPPSPSSDGTYARRNRIVLRLLPNCTTVRTGQEVTIRVLATGDAAKPTRHLLTQNGLTSQIAASCIPTGPTEPQPQPGSHDETLRYTYSQATTDVVTVGVTALCSPFRGQATDSVTITVLPADSPDPEPSPIDASRLLGVWEVEGEDATLTLDGELTVRLPCGQLFGNWGAASAQQLFLAYVNSGQGCLEILRQGGPAWLKAATAYRERDGGRDLLNDAGKVVARLRATGTAGGATEAQRQSWSEPPDLPPGVVPVTTDELLGTWRPLEDQSGKAFVRFDTDGDYSGSDGCNTPGGRWALGTQGRFIALGGITTLIGCQGSNAIHDVQRGARAGLDNGQLLLLDAKGQEVMRLQR